MLTVHSPDDGWFIQLLHTPSLDRLLMVCTVCLGIPSSSNHEVRPPVPVSMLLLTPARNTNVYEERSLGIYASDETLGPSGEKSPSIVMSLIRHHLLGRQDRKSVV